MIVDELRDIAAGSRDIGQHTASQLMETAAFEIQRLQKALETSTTMLEALLVQLNSWGHESAVNARGQIAFNNELLDAVD